MPLCTAFLCNTNYHECSLILFYALEQALGVDRLFTPPCSFSEENRFWQRWGTLGGDLVHYPLMELPYDTHLRDPDDYLLAYSLKTDIYRLSTPYSSIHSVALYGGGVVYTP